MRMSGRFIVTSAAVWMGAVGVVHAEPVDFVVDELISMTEQVGGSVSEDREIPEAVTNWVAEDRIQFPESVGPDFGFMAFPPTQWRPPDPDLSVGRNQIVATVNMQIAIFDKAGNELSNEPIDDFFKEVGGDFFYVDPVTQYDQLANRFVVVAGEHEGGDKTKSRLDFAISKTTNPMDGWWKYRFNLEPYGDYFDFQNLGIGTDAYFVTSDYFDSKGSRLHILAKAPMLNGDPVSLNVVSITNQKSISLAPIDMIDTDAPAEYMVTSFSGLRTRLQLYALEDALGVPKISTYLLPVAFMELPPDATQKGTTRLLPVLDFRVKHGVYRHGSMWITQTVGEENTARVRWYEIAMNGWPTSGQNPVVRQSGTLDLGVDQHNWFSDIGVDAEGDVVITCSRSSSNEFPFISRFVRKAEDPLGMMREEIRMMESPDGPYLGSRWGDYGSIDEDPADPNVFWSHNEYAGSTTNWRTWIGRIDTEQSMVLTVGDLARGQIGIFDVSGSTKNGRVFLVYSLRGMGSTRAPGLGVTLDLKQPKLGASGFADGSGRIEFAIKVPRSVPAVPIWFQAAENRNTSNVVETVIN